MISRAELVRIARFLAVGVLNTLVGLGTTYLCKWLAGLDDVSANAIGYTVGLVNSFAWNKKWTFQHQGALLPALLRFAGVFVVAYALNLATVMFAIRVVHLNSYIAQALGVGPYTVAFYIGTRFFAFKPAPARVDAV